MDFNCFPGHSLRDVGSVSFRYTELTCQIVSKDSFILGTICKRMITSLCVYLLERLCMPWLDFERGGCVDRLEMNGYMEGACAMALEDTAVWKPLVLLIPLRLGLSDINEAYIETLKVNK